MIPDIKQLSPAELLFIRGQASSQKMVHLTLLDLLMKEVLHFKSEPALYGDEKHYIELGKYYATYPALIHEAPFLFPFKAGDKQLELRLYVKILRDYTDGFEGFRLRYVENSLRSRNITQSSFWNVFHVFPLTARGEHLRTELSSRLAEGKKIIQDSLNGHTKALQNLPGLLGSGLLLLDGLEKILRQRAYTETWIHELMESYQPLKQLFLKSEGEPMPPGSACSAYYNVQYTFGESGNSGDSGGGGCGGDNNGCSGNGCSGGGCSGGGCGGGGCGS